MSNKRDPLYSTATDQFHSSPKQSGLTCSVVTPSTSTMSFKTSIRCPMTPGMLSSSGRTLGYSMAFPHQRRQLKPMATGLSPGTPSLMPLDLSSGIENKNYSPMIKTFSDILHPYHPNSISGLSIMTKPSESGPLNNAISSSPTLQSLRT